MPLKANQQSLKQIFDAFTTLDNEYDNVYDQATAAQKKELETNWRVAYNSYQNSLHKFFDASNASVTALTKELKEANKKMDDALTSLQNVTSALKVVAGTIRLAAGLAALAI